MKTGLEPGLWGILATPFRGHNLEVDHASLARLTAHFERIGATGVVALGVFGEGAALNSGEQKDSISTVVTSTSLPVIVGISERNTAPAIEQALTARDAAGSRLRAIMVQVNSSNSDVVIAHLNQIYEASGLPIFLQDYPIVSGIKISIASTLEILEALPFVIGVKSEAPPTAQVITELRAKTNVPLIGGLGGVGLIDELQSGAIGAMTGFSYPEALLATIRSFQEDSFSSACETFAPWLPLANFESQPGIALALRKRIYMERGIFSESSVRPPAARMPKSLEPLMRLHIARAEELLKKIH
jgi:4-hydroxy-tetrahydrodipicolinate synthase